MFCFNFTLDRHPQFIIVIFLNMIKLSAIYPFSFRRKKCRRTRGSEISWKFLPFRGKSILFLIIKMFSPECCYKTYKLLTSCRSSFSSHWLYAQTCAPIPKPISHNSLRAQFRYSYFILGSPWPSARISVTFQCVPVCYRIISLVINYQCCSRGPFRDLSKTSILA